MAVFGAGLLLAGGASTSAFAAPREITIERESGFPVAVTPLEGSTGRTATEALRRDLSDAGPLKLVDSRPGVFVASGQSSGGRIEGTLTGPDGSRVFSRSYASPSLERNTHRFSDDIYFAVTGRPGISSSIIGFVATKSGAKEVYICDYDGRNIRRVTNDQSLCVAPSISPDGAYLAYTGYRSGYADVYLIDLLSGERRRIIDAPGTNSGAAISPEGRRIALTMSHSGNTELYITGVNGGFGTRLTRSSGLEASPTWSPDGDALIFTYDGESGPQLFRISSSGGTPSHIPVGYGHVTEPDWSPDGSKLAFNALTGGSQSIGIYDFSTGRSRLVGAGESPSWGADSRHLAFARGGSLIVLDAENGSASPIVTGMGKISEPTWTR